MKRSLPALRSLRAIRASGRRSGGGFTFVEVLVALAMAMVFLGALYGGFTTALRASHEAQSRLEALRNGRAAVMTIYDEFKAISVFSSSFLIGLDDVAAFGDGIDNDGDGVVDDPLEVMNGRDDDGDFNVLTDDRHAFLDGQDNDFYERFHYVNQFPFSGYFGNEVDDLGDANVDEDLRFGRDALIFRVEPTSAEPDVLFRTITYQIGTYDAQQNVLLRTSRTEFTPQSGRRALEVVSPIAFDCVGLDFLYWNPNGDNDPNTVRTNRPYWTTTWNSLQSGGFQPPQLPLPASIFVMVTMYADPAPVVSYQGGEKIRTLRIPMIVNVEEIIGDIRYPRSSI